MERLTYDCCFGDIHCWQVKGADNRECRQVCEEQEENGCKGCPIALAFDRLAAYEDTGFTPEEVQQMRWIPMEERLPEKHSEYIVCACDEGEPIDERIWGDTVVVCADYYDGGFTWYEGNTEYDISDIVTHWMLLPKPPKEEKKDDQAGCTGLLPQVPGLRGGSNWRPKRGLQHRGRARGSFHGGHSHKVHKGGKMCLDCGRGVQVQKRRTTGKRRRML